MLTSDFDSALLLHKLQTAGETFTPCLRHTDEPGDTLLFNYSVPHQPLLLQPSPSSPFLLPLLPLFSLSSHSLCSASLRFIRSRRDPYIRPAPMHVNQADFSHSNRISVVSWPLLRTLFSISLKGNMSACQTNPSQSNPIVFLIGSRSSFPFLTRHSVRLPFHIHVSGDDTHACTGLQFTHDH